MRYRVIYSKPASSALPLSAWFDDLAAAKAFADKMSAVGYAAAVWEYTAEGAWRLGNR